MAIGDHWEWRGFGPLDEPLKRRLRALWPLLGSEWQVTDRYLWTPGCQVNVKLRGVDLKLKRFLQTAHGLERWREDGQEVFPFPIPPDVVRTVADALGVALPWLPAAALDQPGLWKLLRQAVPPVQLITVEKSRRLGWLSGVGAQRFGAPVLLEVTEVAAPEALVTVAVEHPQPEPVQAAVTGLGLRDGSLMPLNYLQVLAAWAGGRGALDRP